MFRPQTLDDVPWLVDLLDIPADAAWPRYMTPVHPDAVGSYGQALEEWLADQQGIEFRWWQKLATRRQLEHNAAGELVWEVVVDSTSRRSGKSTRLAGLATWRMAHPDLFGEVQTIVHTGSDLGICREVQRRSWRWAEDAAGWVVMRANGKEVIETPTGDRWLVRAQGAVYGWDCSLGVVDEGWDVPPLVVDEGLEPALLERRQPQLILTSTAHRRATPLMRRRIESALTGMGEDWDCLLMLWGAGLADALGDEAVWKAASPHWSEHRAKMIRGKYERAMRGELDPDADDPDPVEGFKAQYLNVWPDPRAPRPPAGEPMVTAARWGELDGAVVPGSVPAVTAVESHFETGVSVARAWRTGGFVTVAVRRYPSLAEAAAAVAEAQAPVNLVGKSFITDPAFAGLLVEPVGSTTRQCVTELRRFVDDGALRHCDDDLTEQVLAVRFSPGPDGPRLRSTGPADAVKAATWAVERARAAVEAPAIF